MELSTAMFNSDFLLKKSFKDIPTGMTVELIKSCAEMAWPEFKSFDIKSDTPTFIKSHCFVL